MPSRYESWGLVVGEAVAAGIAVVAYKLECYPLLFGDFVQYAKPFDADEFKQKAEAEVRNQRAGINYLKGMDVEKLKQDLNWQTSQRASLKLVSNMEKTLEA